MRTDCRSQAGREGGIRSGPDEQHRGNALRVEQPQVEIADAGKAEEEAGCLAAVDDAAWPRVALHVHRLDAALSDGVGRRAITLLTEDLGRKEEELGVPAEAMAERPVVVLRRHRQRAIGAADRRFGLAPEAVVARPLVRAYAS